MESFYSQRATLERCARPGFRIAVAVGVNLLLLVGLAKTESKSAFAALADNSPLFPDGGRLKKGTRPIAITRAPTGPLGVQAFVGLADHLGPAVVSIISVRMPSEEDPLRRSGRASSLGREQGAGVIINPRGFILTNNHVVDRAADIHVRLQDERDLQARLIGRDERTDLALLKIEAGNAPLPWAPLGNSDSVRIGEWVMAIGSPFGLDHTVTVGIVSAKGRREVQPGNQPGYFDFLQTDAPINPGNSGGPLINVRGEVIGINSAMNVVGSGIGFAIPSNIARTVASELHQRGHVLRTWLGVYPQPVTEALRRGFNLPDRRGALIAEVYEPSPAQKAGLEIGDVIVEFDGRKIDRADDLMWLLGISNERPVPVRYYRQGTLRTATLVLKPEAPQDSDEKNASRKPSSLGIAVAEITPQMAAKLGYDDERGVVVLTVEPGSPAMSAGTERGDVILRINDQPVTSITDYLFAIGRVHPGDTLRMLVRREERKQWHNFWLAFIRR